MFRFLGAVGDHRSSRSHEVQFSRTKGNSNDPVAPMMDLVAESGKIDLGKDFASLSNYDGTRANYPLKPLATSADRRDPSYLIVDNHSDQLSSASTPHKAL